MRCNRWLQTGVLVLVVVLATLFTPHRTIRAQGGGALSYGTSAVGTITPEMPLLLYSFSGTSGDLVQIDVAGLSGGLNPTVDLIDPARQILASSQYNGLAMNTQDASLAVVLSTTGVHSLMIGGLNGTTGQFVVQLDGGAPVSTTPLVFGQAVNVTLVQNAMPQHFTFTATDCPTTLTVYNPSPAEPYSYPFIVKVLDERAQIVAVLRGGQALDDRVTVEPLSGTYDVEVWSDDPSLAGVISLLVACTGSAPPCLPDHYGSTGTAVVCPACPPCIEFGECADFHISVDISEHSVVTVTWPVVEEANAAIVSMADLSGTLVYARMIEDELVDTIDLNWWGIGAGTYQIRVTVGSEELGYNICGDVYTLEFEGQGPVDWGPPEDDLPAECTIDIVAPRETIANGLQTFFWTDVPGAESYRLRIYGQFDSVVADGAISAPATSMTLDASRAAIGAGYGGEDDFFIQVNAYRGGESWCANGVRVTRSP